MSIIQQVNKNTVTLNANEIPKKWFNAIPLLPEPLPLPIDPDDDRGSRLELMKRIRLEKLQEQDNSIDQWIDIPKEVIEKYIEAGRPTVLYRARELEKYLDTPAKIFVKREDSLPSGSFKLNTAIAQAYYAKNEGVLGLVTETGAGQWGVSLAYACKMFDIECLIYWVKVSLEQKVYRAALAELYGASILPSPSVKTMVGKEILSKDPTNYGSLGTAIGEAIYTAKENSQYKYVAGSNLPHVLLHQTIIGLETKAQLLSIGEWPDELIACVGGGSNLGGFILPFLPEKLEQGSKLQIIGAESDAAPRLTKGKYEYDHSDPSGLSPLTLSYTLGSNYMPPPVHVGGLRQHSGSAIIGVLRHNKLLEAKAYSQEEAFEAGRVFIQCEKFVPAPETCHAIKAAIDSALDAKRQNKKKTIVICFSGSGLLDLASYKKVLL